jgi:hypothetical protein
VETVIDALRAPKEFAGAVRAAIAGGADVNSVEVPLCEGCAELLDIGVGPLSDPPIVDVVLVADFGDEADLPELHNEISDFLGQEGDQ